MQSEEPVASPAINQAEIKATFAPLFAGTGGIDSWLHEGTPDAVFDRLANIKEEPLNYTQFNQLLMLSHEAAASEGFFRYYWLAARKSHPYDVRKLPGFDKAYLEENDLVSIQHLYWGFYRFYVDALLYFGNIRSAYRFLREKDKTELTLFFSEKRLDTEYFHRRGRPLQMGRIAKDDRYLIAEMACKTYAEDENGSSTLERVLLDAFKEHRREGGGRARIRDLIEGTQSKYPDKQQQLLFSADDILNDFVADENELKTKYARIAEAFSKARAIALENTRKYLATVNDLDVYVATSMRSRQDFRDVAGLCDTIFSDPRLEAMHVRYFDPTLSAADGHEDKGLIECLMVKCSKALVLCTGEKDSYGKDAEAAMALSLGKPVIFVCNEAQRTAFYRDVHPLSRLIHFETGVAVGAMVTTEAEHVSEILHRVFSNDMEYEVEQPRPGHLRLKEKLTGSVIRLQTSDNQLRETFWNHYHERNHGIKWR